MPVPLVHRQDVDFVLCGTVARHAAVGCRGWLFVILWLSKCCIGIHRDSTSICIS